MTYEQPVLLPAAAAMSIATAPRPFTFVGFPVASWALAIRVWIAVVVALYAGFWLQLETPYSAAITVGILALPTRGQALEKATFRLTATILGVVASIAIVGIFSQTRDLLLFVFAAWIGLCVYVAGLADGNRAYAAVLSGYTVALVAMQHIDTPLDVFDSGLARGAAIVLGIVSIAIVNDLLVAPDRYLGLESQLAALHRRVRDYAKAIVRGETADPTTMPALLREAATLRSDLMSLAGESGSGANRSAAARSTIVALVAELNAARALRVLPLIADPVWRERLSSALDQAGQASFAAPSTTAQGGPSLAAAASQWLASELLRRDRQVREGLSALDRGDRPGQLWRAPLYRSHRLAAEAGLRAACWLAMSAGFLVVMGWPATEASLAQIAVLIGLGATTPSPRGFTAIALVALPIAIVLAGILEFPILDGVTEFPLLALALGPFVIGATLVMTLSNQKMSSIGRLNLIFILAILAPSNPQHYNPETFLFTSLFVCLSAGLLFAAQLLVPPLSDERRVRWLLTSARRELARLPFRNAQGGVLEEAMFRDAMRIAQIAGMETATPQQAAAVAETERLFDQAGLFRLCRKHLSDLAVGPLAGLARHARRALALRDAPHLREAALSLHDAADGDARAIAASAAVYVASLVLDEEGAA